MNKILSHVNDCADPNVHRNTDGKARSGYKGNTRRLLSSVQGGGKLPLCSALRHTEHVQMETKNLQTIICVFELNDKHLQTDRLSHFSSGLRKTSIFPQQIKNDLTTTKNLINL